MKNRIIKHITAKKSFYTPAAFGFLALFVYFLPFIVFGKDSYFLIFENLDSEVIFNKIITDNFFNFSGIVESFMDIDIRAFNTFSVFQIFFYKIFDPFVAYMLNDFILRIVAYTGMFLAINTLLRKKYLFISIICAIVFMFLPHFSVYGLTGAGLPLLFWVLYRFFLYANDSKKNRWELASLYFLIVFFAFSSSLILSGWFIILGLTGLSIFFLSKKEYRRTQYHFYVVVILLALIYFMLNIKMISLMFSGYESHRINWSTRDVSFTRVTQLFFLKLVQYFFYGQHHIGLFCLTISTTCLITSLCFIMNKSNKKFKLSYYNKMLNRFILINFIIALSCAILGSPLFLNLMKFFKLDGFIFTRLAYLTLFTWFAAFAFALVSIYNFFKKISQRKFISKFAFFLVLIIACVSVIEANAPKYYIQKNNVSGERYEDFFFANYIHLFSGKSSLSNPTWRQFYDETLFAEIANEINQPKSDYRVASLGIMPGVSQYNGFYTLDGHSQLYSFEYWQQFSKVMEYEISDTPFLKKWFYQWGHQCYLMSTELYNERGKLDFVIPKNSGIEIMNTNLDFQALKGIADGRDLYIFSAVKINQYHDTNFISYFERHNSWWGVFLYKF